MTYPNTNPTYRYLDDGAPDGTILGQTSASLISFWGGTPSAQVAFSQASVSGATSAFSSATANEIVTLLNEIRAAMVSMGLKAD